MPLLLITINILINVIFIGFYNKFVETLLASFYVSAPQGRISAHWGLRYLSIELVIFVFISIYICIFRWKDKDDILASNVFAHEFKTSKTFGYQPIVCSKLSREILHFFLGITIYIFNLSSITIMYIL